MSVLCPLTKKDILEPVICADGFTYERSALLKYLRKYKKSPVTGEPLNSKHLVFDKKYLESKEQKAENYLENIREEISNFIEIKKQYQNFEYLPSDIEVYLKKNEKSWYCYAENRNNPKLELSERVLKSIIHNANAMYFFIEGSKHVYKTIYSGNGKLNVIGSDDINDIYEKNGKVIISKWSSFAKEFVVKKWLDNTCAEDIMCIPLRVLVGLEENGLMTYGLDDPFNESSLKNLNYEQKSVFLRNNMRNLEVIEGPPGTGKTTVISHLLDYFTNTIHEKKTYTLILSEKNKGVDAVAERLTSDLKDKVISFGSENIGESTEKYLIENKIKNHIFINELNSNIEKIDIDIEQKIRKLKRLTYTLFPRNMNKNLNNNNIGFIRYHVNNSKIHFAKKKKICDVLDEIDNINKKLWVLKNSLPNIKNESKLDCIKKCEIILVTLGSLHQVSQFFKDNNEKNLDFTIIVDEASTMLSWQGFYLEHFVNELGSNLKNLILIGDSKQLPPYWPDNKNPNQEKLSFLDFAKEKCKPIKFCDQYRLPNDIMKILNKEYYFDSPLRLGNNNVLKNTISWNHSDGNEEEENNREASSIIKLLSNIDSINNSILIVSPYKSQCELIQKMCETYYFKVNVMTLDSVQGHESDIVIVSMVKIKPTSFLTNKRMCVLISRAKKNLILFGNRQHCLKSSNSCLRRLARFKEFSK